MTAPIASFAAATCLAVVSAARTIMSSNFSRLSPDDVAIKLTPQSSCHCTYDRACKNQTVAEHMAPPRSTSHQGRVTEVGRLSPPPSVRYFAAMAIVLARWWLCAGSSFFREQAL